MCVGYLLFGRPFRATHARHEQILEAYGLSEVAQVEQQLRAITEVFAVALCTVGRRTRPIVLRHHFART